MRASAVVAGRQSCLAMISAAILTSSAFEDASRSLAARILSSSPVRIDCAPALQRPADRLRLEDADAGRGPGGVGQHAVLFVEQHVDEVLGSRQRVLHPRARTARAGDRRSAFVDEAARGVDVRQIEDLDLRPHLVLLQLPRQVVDQRDEIVVDAERELTEPVASEAMSGFRYTAPRRAPRRRAPRPPVENWMIMPGQCLRTPSCTAGELRHVRRRGLVVIANVEVAPAVAPAS